MLQKQKIEKWFPKLNVTLSKDTLICSGYLYPISKEVGYRIFISYNVNKPPMAWIRGNKEINECPVHKYKKGNLCLYYPLEFKWSLLKNIHETIIPWISEWIVCYEYWKIFGVWGAPESPHSTQGNEKDK